MQKTIAVGVLLLCAIPLFAAPRTFVSAETGADSNPCNRSLPCRSFAAALLVTDADGEVVVLDSGGYGPVTITQSVSIISPQGVHAGITAASADGIIVSAGDSANVLLKNLTLSYAPAAQSSTAGIRADSVHALYVEGCTITAFDRGIDFAPTTSGARLYVTGSVIQRGYFFSNYGIRVAGPNLSLRAAIDSTQIYDCTNAVYLENAHATIRDCVATTGSYGYTADFTSEMVVTRSIAKDFSSGFYANTSSIIVVNRCLSTKNRLYGVDAGNGSNIYVSETSMVDNYQAAVAGATGAIRTRGDNSAQGNSHSNGVFTIGYSAH